MPLEPSLKVENSSSQSKRRSWISPRLVGILIALCVLASLSYFLGRNFSALRPFIENMGPWAPLAFIALYLILAPCFFPLSLLDLSCGAIFGVTRGFEILVIAGALAAIEMFVGSRWLFADSVSRFIESRPRLRHFYQLAGLQDWKILALLRLSPTNFAVVNYILGAARVGFVRYMVTWLILVPKALLHASIGHAIYQLGQSSPSRGTLARSESVLLILGLGSALLLVAVFSRRMRRALEKAAEQRIES